MGVTGYNAPPPAWGNTARNTDVINRTPIHQQHKIMLAMDQNIIFCPALYFADIHHLMLIAFQYFDNIFQPRNIFLSGMLWWTNARNINISAMRKMAILPKNGCKIRSICPLRRAKVCVSHCSVGKKNEIPRQRYREEANHHRPVTGAVDRISCAQCIFDLLMMILTIVVRFFIRANTDVVVKSDGESVIKPAASGFSAPFLID